MGLFDNVGSALKELVGQVGATAVPGLISVALDKSEIGGLQGLIAKLQQGGLNDQVQSWLGNGSNLPITAEQIQAALGSDQVKQLAEHFGLPVDNVLGLLAQHLPSVVDKASPHGTLEPNAPT